MHSTGPWWMKTEKMGASPISNATGNESVSKRPTSHVSHHTHNFYWIKCQGLNAFIHLVFNSSSALTIATNHQCYQSVVAFIFFVLHISSHTSSSDTQLRVLLLSMLQVWKQRDQIIIGQSQSIVWFLCNTNDPLISVIIHHEGCFNVYEGCPLSM